MIGLDRQINGGAATPKEGLRSVAASSAPVAELKTNRDTDFPQASARRVGVPRIGEGR